jgi:hypothetical protein
MRENGDVHPAMLTKTALRSGHRRYYDVYRSLSASRTWSQVGPNPIQVSEVHSYMEMAGIEDPSTRLKYLRLIQGMDAIELKSIREKTKKT